MTQPADLLAALLDACRMGLVTHCEAAQLLCMRKEDVGDLVAWRMVERAVWRTYVAAFHDAFPECNARLWQAPDRIPHAPARPWPLPDECIHYGADMAALLTPSQGNLFDPISNAAHDFAEPEIEDAWDNS